MSLEPEPEPAFALSVLWINLERVAERRGLWEVLFPYSEENLRVENGINCIIVSFVSLSERLNILIPVVVSSWSWSSLHGRKHVRTHPEPGSRNLNRIQVRRELRIGL
jgi:hypothetical protein